MAHSKLESVKNGIEFGHCFQGLAKLNHSMSCERPSLDRSDSCSRDGHSQDVNTTYTMTMNFITSIRINPNIDKN
jgi:hypothetical protein